MKFLIINTDYPNFLTDIYSEYPGLEYSSYDEQMRVRYESLFGVADFYSSNLRSLGHEAKDIFFNNYFLQKAWADEHNISTENSAGIQIDDFLKRTRNSGYFSKLTSFFDIVNQRIKKRTLYKVLEKQIQDYHPDVLLNLAPDVIFPSFFEKSRPFFGVLAGQIAAPVPKNFNFENYDLILSSLPNFVSNFKENGIRSEYFRLGFEPKILNHLDKGRSSGQIPVSFVGSFSRSHISRIKLFEYILKYHNIQIWGNAEGLPSNSCIRQVNHGPVWGKKMYNTLRKSKITVNHHIDISGDFANNCRLYESTGVGAMLITDRKKNLGDLFEIDKEVVTYRTPEECGEKITYYLGNEKERQAIASAGQKRTLTSHTYYQRMQDLIEILSNTKK